MKAFELLDRPEKWTQNAAARDKDGVPVLHNSEEAVCWCISGAIWKCYAGHDDIHSGICYEHIGRLREHLDKIPPTWNDNDATYEDVIKVLKELDI